jgi:hypothetical protein
MATPTLASEARHVTTASARGRRRSSDTIEAGTTMVAALLQDRRMTVVPRLPMAAGLILGGAVMLAMLVPGGPAARMTGAVDAVSWAQTELARWSAGATVTGPSAVSSSVVGPRVVATVVDLRGFADPVARAQAELAGWAVR